MKAITCPYCKEEIREDAVLCKHCHQKLRYSRAELVMEAIGERVRVVPASTVSLPSVSRCGALCQAKFSGNQQALSRCLDDCKAADAVAAAAERLHRELLLSFAEVVLGGGDIDPVPFEAAVRKIFSGAPQSGRAA